MTSEADSIVFNPRTWAWPEGVRQRFEHAGKPAVVEEGSGETTLPPQPITEMAWYKEQEERLAASLPKDACLGFVPVWNEAAQAYEPWAMLRQTPETMTPEFMERWGFAVAWTHAVEAPPEARPAAGKRLRAMWASLDAEPPDPEDLAHVRGLLGDVG